MEASDAAAEKEREAGAASVEVGQGASEVFQIVMEDGSELIALPEGAALVEAAAGVGAAAADTTAGAADGAGGDDATALTAVVAETSEEGGVTYAYLRVEDPQDGAGNDGEKDETGESSVGKAGFAVVEGGKEGEVGATATTVFVEATEEAQPPAQYLLQSHEHYRSDLLHSMLSLDSSPSSSLLDLPVFCRDGVGWSSRLLLSAMSPMLRQALSGAGADEGGQACLILPDVDRAEFLTFSRALFAKRGDASLDFLVLIKCAELLGANLSMTTDSPPMSQTPPSVDYSSLRANPAERGRVLAALGFDVEVPPSSSSSAASESTTPTPSAEKLVRVLHSQVCCPICHKVLVDGDSLKRHHASMHVGKQLTTVIKNGREYECETCHKVFALAVSVRKHKWLCHRRVPRPVVVAADERALDRAAAKLRRAQERFADMVCSLCGMEASSWKQLRMHMLDHSKERPFKCEQCGKGFKENQKLRRHMLVHTGEKKHKCSICGKAFGLKHNLTSHEKIHKGRGVFCSYCGKMFSQSKNLREHESQHASLGHRVTQDRKQQGRQKLAESKRGRKSILELDRRRGRGRAKQQQQEAE